MKRIISVFLALFVSSSFVFGSDPIPFRELNKGEKISLKDQDVESFKKRAFGFVEAPFVLFGAVIICVAADSFSKTNFEIGAVLGAVAGAYPAMLVYNWVEKRFGVLTPHGRFHSINEFFNEIEDCVDEVKARVEAQVEDPTLMIEIERLKYYEENHLRAIAQAVNALSIAISEEKVDQVSETFSRSERYFWGREKESQSTKKTYRSNQPVVDGCKEMREKIRTLRERINEIRRRHEQNTSSKQQNVSEVRQGLPASSE